MIRTLALFVILVGAFHFIVVGWRAATSKEKWSFIRTLTYSVGLAILAIVAMTLLVIFF